MDDDVYAIVRLSLCLEEPLKTRVRNLLKKSCEIPQDDMASSSGMFVDSFYVFMRHFQLQWIGGLRP